jgi:apolipoprotein D and lipocalin family protein
MRLRWGLLVAVMATASMAWGQVTAVPVLDFSKFTGTWYEIAKYPTKTEKACAGDALMMFTTSTKAGHFDVVRSCTTKDDTPDAANFGGKTEDKNGDGKLEVGSWPFHKHFWVLAVGPEYEWMVVGDPGKKTLWVLSRKTTLTDDQMAAAKGKAQAEGFDVGKLVVMKQGQ